MIRAFTSNGRRCPRQRSLFALKISQSPIPHTLGLAIGAFCSLLFFFSLPRANAEPPRAVSLTPNVTELAIALGAANRLVGISDYCHPPNGLDLPRCGGAINPHFERILSLHPQLLFLLGKMEKIQAFADRYGIRTLSVTIDSFDDLLRETLRVGSALGVSPSAERFAKQLRKQHDEILERGRGLPSYRTLILVGREAGAMKRMTAANEASYFGDMLRVAGGENIFKGQSQHYFTPSREAILALQPEVIFDLRGDTEDPPSSLERLKKDWQAERSLPAVKKGRVVVAANPSFMIPGPRMLNLANFFQEHLRRFSEEDLKPSRSSSRE